MSFTAANLIALAGAYATERENLDPGGSSEDLAYDAALRVGEELSLALAADLVDMTTDIEG